MTAMRAEMEKKLRDVKKKLKSQRDNYNRMKRERRKQGSVMKSYASILASLNPGAADAAKNCVQDEVAKMYVPNVKPHAPAHGSNATELGTDLRANPSQGSAPEYHYDREVGHHLGMQKCREKGLTPSHYQ